MTRMATIGGAGQTVIASWLPLLYLEGANLQDMHSLTRNPPYLATASPMRCEYGPGLWQNIRKTDQSCLMNRVIPRTTRKPNWNHVDRGNLVRHTVTTMLERAVEVSEI